MMVMMVFPIIVDVMVVVMMMSPPRVIITHPFETRLLRLELKNTSVIMTKN